MTGTESTWQCQRCLWIFTGREGDEIPQHSADCPFHADGSDPAPGELQISDRSEHAKTTPE